MRRRPLRRRRSGTTTLEFALTCPITFLLLFATMVGGAGVFRYQEIASLAREASRWASVHGAQYAEETGQPAATAEDIYKNVILPAAVALNPEHLSYEVTWDSSNLPLSVTSDYSEAVGNTVTVTVTYQWFPEVFLAGPFTLTSTSTAQMVY